MPFTSVACPVEFGVIQSLEHVAIRREHDQALKFEAVYIR
jgi:hypothetical protein